MLTAREREVLQLVAEGLSNHAIGERLEITLRATQKHISSIFEKLGLPATGSEHRRVLAVLRFLGTWRPYSYCSARRTSRRDARRAGRTAAAMPAPTATAVSATSVGTGRESPMS